jgi:predicted dehydrogenase
MPPLRFALLGAGFWARPQLAAWREIPGARCVAIYNRTLSKAQALAREFDIPAAGDDLDSLIRETRPDFVDIVTDVNSHPRLVEWAARRGLPVICQKPLAPTLAEARRMARACAVARVPFLVHENWRWQRPIREFKAVMDSGRIGAPFRARIDYCNSFPVFDNQPFLKDLEQFILTDIGTHILDTARYLFGEATSLYCHTTRVRPDIRGEDVATVMLRMRSGAVVTCNMSYASRVEHDRFPETFVFVEAAQGSLELGPDYWIRETTREGTLARRCPPPRYDWADPRYALVHASIVDCHRNLLRGVAGRPGAETTAGDNLRTLELVFGAYRSAASGRPIPIRAD